MLGNRISVRGAGADGGVGTTQHNILNNLDYTSAGHTGFVSTGTVQTISGAKTFQAVINADGGVRLGNTSISGGGMIRWTGTDFEGHTGVGWISLTSGTGTNNHAALGNLDFASSGHTGFMPLTGDTFIGDVTFSGADLYYGDNVISGTGDVVVGEFGMKVYVQGSEPTLGSNNKLAMWEDTSTGETYLVYKDSSGNQKLVELA